MTDLQPADLGEPLPRDRYPQRPSIGRKISRGTNLFSYVYVNVHVVATLELLNEKKPMERAAF